MHVLHLLKHCERGNGHVHVAVDLACAQAASGHEVSFASQGGTYVPLLEAHGVRHHVVEQSGAGAILKGLPSLVRLCRRTRPDVIHAHMMAAAVLGKAAALASGARLVTTMHNSFDGHSGLMRLGDRVVAVSKAERALLLARGFRPSRLRMVENGPIGSPRESLASDGPCTLPVPCVMTLSGLHGRKRVDDAIRAFAKVADQFPDWSLAVVGEGPDAAILRSLAVDLGIAERVTFAGSVLNPKALLQQADVFVNASEAEPFGLVLAEARAAGCAIVATRVGGMPDVLDDGRAGVLVPVRDPDALAAALRALMADPAELARWQASALDGADRFGTAAMARGYDKVYAELARDHGVDVGAATMGRAA